jgi:hypothetical protein
MGKTMRARIWKINQLHTVIKPQRHKDTEKLEVIFQPFFSVSLSLTRLSWFSICHAGKELR